MLFETLMSVPVNKSKEDVNSRIRDIFRNLKFIGWRINSLFLSFTVKFKTIFILLNSSVRGEAYITSYV